MNSHYWYPHAAPECSSEAFSSPPVAPFDQQWSPSCQWNPPAPAGYDGGWTPQSVHNTPAYAWQQWAYAQNPLGAYATPMFDSRRTMKKPPRNTFTADQLRILNYFFSANKYLTKDTKISIAAKTGLTQRQVKIWFQNQRYKSKKTSPASSSDSF